MKKCGKKKKKKKKRNKLITESEESQVFHVQQTGISLRFSLSSSDLFSLCLSPSLSLPLWRWWCDDEKRRERERSQFPLFYVTNKEINKSLWAFDSLWWGGAARSSWTIYEAVTAAAAAHPPPFPSFMCVLACWVCVCVGQSVRWLVSGSRIWNIKMFACFSRRTCGPAEVRAATVQGQEWVGKI